MCWILLMKFFALHHPVQEMIGLIRVGAHFTGPYIEQVLGRIWVVSNTDIQGIRLVDQGNVNGFRGLFNELDNRHRAGKASSYNADFFHQ